MALSVSGADVQGEHIVSPLATKSASTVRSKLWVLHKEASYADAWSTACYLMDDGQLEHLSDQVRIIKDI